MLWALIAVLMMMWLLGNVMSYTAGGLIHLLLVIAIVMTIFNFITGRKTV